MVALIVVIVGCGIMAVGNLKGWFGENSESPVISKEITGVANMERSGVAYTLSEKTPVKGGDILETETGSEADFEIRGAGSISMWEKAVLTADACDEDNVQLTVNEGEFYGIMEDDKNLLAIAGDAFTATPGESVFSMSVRQGSREISVFSGSLTVKGDGGQEKISAGEKLLITGEKGDKWEKDKLRAVALSDFQIAKLLEGETDDICFTDKKLKKVQADRKQETKAAEEALEDEAVALVSENSSTSGETSDKKVLTCTIQIQCKSILSNMDRLKEGKNRYVPSNGVILATSKVEFNQGDTAYDVTKRACSAAGIQIEAAYTPAYGSYYVEGMNHLYEFDCGEMSGWMYKVNGWAPNYGCSEYELKNGDSIVWYYTCTGN